MRKEEKKWRGKRLIRLGEALTELNSEIAHLHRVRESEKDISLRLRAYPEKTEKEIRAELRKERTAVKAKIRTAYKKTVVWAERTGQVFDFPLEKILDDSKF